MLVVFAAGSLRAQSNDDDHTPLNSRIKRERQFPLEPPATWRGDQRSKLNRERGKAMAGQFAHCLYDRSHEKSLDLLAKTDLGFEDFHQTDYDLDKVGKIFGFEQCAGRVAQINGSGVAGRFSPAVLRQWLLQEAYFDRYPEDPSWVKPGNVIAERSLPLSASDTTIQAILYFSDCIIAGDPYGADYFFRTAAGSEDELPALKALVPAIEPCLPEGRQMQIEPVGMRTWIGEALWHAANHSGPMEESLSSTD